MREGGSFRVFNFQLPVLSESESSNIVFLKINSVTYLEEENNFVFFLLIGEFLSFQQAFRLHIFLN